MMPTINWSYTTHRTKAGEWWNRSFKLPLAACTTVVCNKTRYYSIYIWLLRRFLLARQNQNVFLTWSFRTSFAGSFCPPHSRCCPFLSSFRFMFLHHTKIMNRPFVLFFSGIIVFLSEDYYWPSTQRESVRELRRWCVIRGNNLSVLYAIEFVLW